MLTPLRLPAHLLAFKNLQAPQESSSELTRHVLKSGIISLGLNKFTAVRGDVSFG